MVQDFEDVAILDETEQLGDAVWQDVLKWLEFARDTVGKQLVRAVDSVGANIAEAYGRYHYGEKIQFLYYARGSLFESKNWLNRCIHRSLLSVETAESYSATLSNIAKQLNGFVRHLKQRKTPIKTKSIKENSSTYSTIPSNNNFLFTPAELNWLT